MISPNTPPTERLSRRNALKWGFGAAAAAVLPLSLMACGDDDDVAPILTEQPTVALPRNNVGILNFALFLEELEAAFYRSAVSSGKVTNTTEADYLTALRDHEIAHVSFIRAALTGQNQAPLIPTGDAFVALLNMNTLNTMLATRQSILTTAVALEDTGVHAYNGAGAYVSNDALGQVIILAAGSIVSVEARHAAGVRALLGQPVTEVGNTGVTLDTTLNPAAFTGKAYDELYTPAQIRSIVGSLNILKTGVTLGGDLFN